MTTVITLGYNANYVVDPKDVSTLLTILAKSTRVDDRYIGDGESVWVPEKDNRVNVRQDDSRVVASKAEYEAIKEAFDAARREREEAEEAARAAAEEAA